MVNGFQLKIIGIILMTLDHIHQYFEFTGVPIYFKWLGRVVAPLFIFLAIEGYNHTRDVKNYLKRLYIAAVLMNIGNIVIPSIISRADGMTIPNNIFEGIFLTIFYIFIIDSIREAMSNKDGYKASLYLLASSIPLISGLLYLFARSMQGLEILSSAIDIFIPDVFTSEGGIFLILIGIVINYSRGDKWKMVSRYALLSLLTINYGDISVNSLFFQNYQWMMIFAVVFMLLYNGKKGLGLKYLFYLYYPLHIYIFYVLSALIMIQL